MHSPAGGVLVGRARIERFWSPSGTDRVGHRIEPMLRRILGDGHVLEVGRWHSQQRDAEGSVGPWLWGCYSVVWRRDAGGAWRMLYDGWTAPHDEDWACRPQE